jgi:hypothetical protein
VHNKRKEGRFLGPSILRDAVDKGYREVVNEAEKINMNVNS